MVQRLKLLWNAIFVIDSDSTKELSEILQRMRSLPKEDRKLIGKSLKK
jgi:hypothetical protein